jgi:hypothetical protein
VSTLAFTDQKRRLERLLSNALDGCLIDTIVEEAERRLVINAHRTQGQPVGVRFLGLHHWEATADPQPNSPIKLTGVSIGGGGKAFLRAFLPWAHGPMSLGSRVRIAVGNVRLTIDCEDAEWWQEETAPGAGSNPI